MKVIQLSDPHVRGDGKLSFGVVDTPKMLRDCIDHICSLDWTPDAIVISGDLADSGAPDAYELLQEELKRLPAPLFVLPGNHDRREGILKYLSEYCPTEPEMAPYICYTYEELPMRIVVFDSTHPGSHSGHLHPEVAAWLEKTLAEKPDAPTLLFSHHVPFLTGFGEMDEPYENSEQLKEILTKYPNVRFCCGHIHRPITSTFGNNVMVTAPAVSMQIAMDLTPEGGDAFRMETPGYMIHHWHEGQCNSHVCQIPSQATFAGPYKFVGSVNPE